MIYQIVQFAMTLSDLENDKSLGLMFRVYVLGFGV